MPLTQREGSDRELRAGLALTKLFSLIEDQTAFLGLMEILAIDEPALQWP